MDHFDHRGFVGKRRRWALQAGDPPWFASAYSEINAGTYVEVGEMCSVDTRLVEGSSTYQRFFSIMKRLPPNKFVTRVVNGQPVYLYADPLVCRCVYFGGQQNWGAYRQEVLAKQLADEAQMTAMMNQEAWEWGPWGWP